MISYMRMSNTSPLILTIQRQQRVVHLALHLPCTLRSTRHPQAFIQTHCSDDGIASVGRLFPLGQGCGGDDANPAAKCQEVPQQLETRVGHFLSFRSRMLFFVSSSWVWSSRCLGLAQLGIPLPSRKESSAPEKSGESQIHFSALFCVFVVLHFCCYLLSLFQFFFKTPKKWTRKK